MITDRFISIIRCEENCSLIARIYSAFSSGVKVAISVLGYLTRCDEGTIGNGCTRIFPKCVVCVFCVLLLILCNECDLRIRYASVCFIARLPIDAFHLLLGDCIGGKCT